MKLIPNFIKELRMIPTLLVVYPVMGLVFSLLLPTSGHAWWVNMILFTVSCYAILLVAFCLAFAVHKLEWKTTLREFIKEVWTQ